MMMEQLTVMAVVNVVHDFLSFHKHMTQLKNKKKRRQHWLLMPDG